MIADISSVALEREAWLPKQRKGSMQYARPTQNAGRSLGIEDRKEKYRLR